MPSEDADDLNALMISMMDECIVYPGERPWRDPGPMRPGGNKLYAKVGGVYPIALMVDRLVDALLADDRVEIPIDGQKRNEVRVSACPPPSRALPEMSPLSSTLSLSLLSLLSLRRR